MVGVMKEETSVSSGRISEYEGKRRTSENVRCSSELKTLLAIIV